MHNRNMIDVNVQESLFHNRILHRETTRKKTKLMNFRALQRKTIAVLPSRLTYAVICLAECPGDIPVLPARHLPQKPHIYFVQRQLPREPELFPGKASSETARPNNTQVTPTVEKGRHIR